VVFKILLITFGSDFSKRNQNQGTSGSHSFLILTSGSRFLKILIKVLGPVPQFFEGCVANGQNPFFDFFEKHRSRIHVFDPYPFLLYLKKERPSHDPTLVDTCEGVCTYRIVGSYGQEEYNEKVFPVHTSSILHFAMLVLEQN
jgi:hypothetical protein